MTVVGPDHGVLAKTVFDVAVVGAGPAGSVTALLAARAGLRTLILDRTPFPRPKPCGDCLSPDLARVLDRLDLLQTVLAADPAKLAGWKIVAPAGNSFEGRFSDIASDPRLSSALAISRDRLDAILLAQARDAGTHVVTAARVTNVEPAANADPTGRIIGRYEGAQFVVRARLIVGADGLRSVVARAIGAVRPAHRGLRKISLTAHVTGVSDANPMGEMHVADGMCIGIAPVNGAATRRWSPSDPATPVPAWNVTLVADAERFGRAIARDPARFFVDAVRAFPALDNRLDHIQPIGPRGRGRDSWLLRSGPFDRPTRRTTAGNVALVGDAAGYYDPFTGQGMHQAITGAERLAAAVTDTISGRLPRAIALRRYAGDLRRQARGPRVLQRAIEAVMSRPRIATKAVTWLAHRPGIVNALLATTGDLVPVRSLFEPAVLRAFVASPEPPIA